MLTYPTLMVTIDQGEANAAVLRVASDLAARFQAYVIGIAAVQPAMSIYAEGYAAGSFVDQGSADAASGVADAEARFRHAFSNRADAIEWRCEITLVSPAEYIAAEARSADLLITGASETGAGINAGDLVMAAGRPVLTVPRDARKLDVERIMIAWQDSREARRAATASLPLLRLASRVLVVEVVGEADIENARMRGRDVVRWLDRHGVAAEAIVSSSTGSDLRRLCDIASEQQVGLVVAGAFGHGRLHEWMLGGVTRGLLSDRDRCLLLSH